MLLRFSGLALGLRRRKSIQFHSSLFSMIPFSYRTSSCPMTLLGTSNLERGACRLPSAQENRYTLTMGEMGHDGGVYCRFKKTFRFVSDTFARARQNCPIVHHLPHHAAAA